ncbi:MAG: alpha/beta hydrolase fold domain-containing protein, partial [Gammaproteobacteria bacterium]
MKRTWKWIAGVGLLALLAALALSQARNPELRKDVVYRQVDGEALKLDLVQPPKDGGPFPLVIWIHGGAWRIGDRKDNHEGMRDLAKLGYASASVQYRFAPKYKFPAQLDDVRAALAFLRAHAKEYNIDPARIGVCGGSAGGQLALLLGLAHTNGDGQTNAVRAVVNFYGPTD